MNDYLSRSQVLLLQAALLEGEPARIAWQQWQARADLDRLGPGVYPLMPMLYQNLCQLGVQHPWLPRLKGIYRRAWYAHQLVWRDLAAVLSALHDAGVPTLLLGSAALNLRHQKAAPRLVDSLEMRVPFSQTEAAMGALQDLRARFSAWLQAHAAKGYRLKTSTWVLDLHWHVLPQCPGQHLDDEFWRRANEIRVDGLMTWVLDATDDLFRVCLNAAGPARLGACADAWLLVQSEPALDWPRLVSLAQRCRATLWVQAVLTHLRTNLQSPVPQEILRQLNDTPISRVERREYWAMIDPDSQHLASAFWLCWGQYMRAVRCNDEMPTPWGLASFLQHRWALDHMWQIPVHITSRLKALMHFKR